MEGLPRAVERQHQGHLRLRQHPQRRTLGLPGGEQAEQTGQEMDPEPRRQRPPGPAPAAGHRAYPPASACAASTASARVATSLITRSMRVRWKSSTTGARAAQTTSAP